LNAWTEMALQARDKPECCNECLKCGLEVKWPSDMSSDEFLILMADEIAETKALMADVGTKATTWKEVWRTFDAVRNRLQARLDDANRRLSLLKDKPPEKSALTDEEAEKERSEEARITNLLAILPEHNRQMQQVNNQLTDRKRNLAAMVMGGINEEIISSRERGATTEALTALFEKIGKQETSLVAMDKHIGQLSVLAGQWTQLNTRMGKTVDEHNKTVSLLEQPLPDVSAPEGVTDVLGWWEQSLALKQQEREQAVGREQQANSNYTSVNNRFFDFQRRMEADKEKDKLLGDLRRLKDLLTVEGLPRAYVTYQFEAIARLTQESLVRLDADFAISIDPDRELAFSFVRLDEPGGYVMQAEKLSGGQKVKLAVAFLMAVQQRLVSQVGVLVLDEPSVHLDEASVGALVEFVRGLGQELKNADSQVWIVDHAKEMTAALEKCLVLGSPEKG
jgi:DNA repair exonuclease SbcCD ATPase subunit